MDTQSGTRTGAALHRAIVENLSLNEEVYAVVDSARDKELARAARDHFGLTRYSLLGWDTPDHMKDVVPYLVPLKFQKKYPYPGSEFIDLLADRRGKSVGIIILAYAKRHRMTEHLQTLLEAEDERGTRYYFRFWDPRVLKAYLPTCNEAETGVFFGPIRKILMEADDPDRLLICSTEEGELVQKELPLTAPREEGKTEEE